jgi:hypothetical protein
VYGDEHGLCAIPTTLMQCAAIQEKHSYLKNILEEDRETIETECNRAVPSTCGVLGCAHKI